MWRALYSTRTRPVSGLVRARTWRWLSSLERHRPASPGPGPPPGHPGVAVQAANGDARLVDRPLLRFVHHGRRRAVLRQSVRRARGAVEGAQERFLIGFFVFVEDQDVNGARVGLDPLHPG